MLYGGVSYRLKADPEKDVYVPWAGRAVFAPQKEGEDVKMQFYQVYLVRCPCFSCSIEVLVFANEDCRIRLRRRGRSEGLRESVCLKL